jgi:hypothetical protein
MNIGLMMSVLITLILTVYREHSAMAAQVETYFVMSGGIES